MAAKKAKKKTKAQKRAEAKQCAKARELHREVLGAGAK